MTGTKLEPLLDYEDYCQDEECPVDIKTKKNHNRGERKNGKKKRSRPAQAVGVFSFEKLIAEKLTEMRELVSRAERRAMKNRDLSVTKLRDNVHTHIKNIRNDKKSRLLDKYRRLQKDEKSGVQQDEDQDSIFALVRGFSKLTCLVKINGDESDPINVRKRKASPIDAILYYDFPERKIIKLF